MERVCVFIDGSNLFFSLINNGIRTNFDYGKFVQKLVGKDRKLVRIYYYDAPLNQVTDPQRYKGQQRFLGQLANVDYLEIRFGRLARGRQKGVDVKLAVDMIDYAIHDCYDTAILVSGDSDLVPAVQLVKSTGRHVELSFFDKCYHLQQVCDKTLILNKGFFEGY